MHVELPQSHDVVQTKLFLTIRLTLYRMDPHEQ